MVLLIQYTILFACILMLVALGGCFSEHSGVINLGLEGIMVMGAMGGALMMRYLPAGTSRIYDRCADNSGSAFDRFALCISACGRSDPF